MTRIAKWIGMALGALALLAVLAYAVLVLLSHRVFDRRYDVAPVAIALPTDSLAAVRGQRLARIRGCPGCHGRELGGETFFDEPWVARLVAPNLTRLVPGATDQELARVLRRGVRLSGRGVFSMPSPMFYHLSDADLGDILAYLRTLSPLPDSLPADKLRLLGRLGLATGQYPPLIDLIDTTVGYPAVTPLEPPEALGRYLALSTCTECHGLDLQGDPESGTPSLRIVGGYSADDFARLMRTGVPLGGRELDLMKDVALGRTTYLTDQEVSALYAFLRALSDSTARGGS
jgi:mono/diheme cytochrome c family protein